MKKAETKVETKIDVDTGGSTSVIRVRGTQSEKTSKPPVQTSSTNSTNDTSIYDYMVLVVLSFGVLSMSLIAYGVFRLANVVEAN